LIIQSGKKTKDNQLSKNIKLPIPTKLKYCQPGFLGCFCQKDISGETSQVSLTDPGCRAMKSNSIGRTIGYNVQTAVDKKHHLIVSHYVTNAVVDRAIFIQKKEKPELLFLINNKKYIC